APGPAGNGPPGAALHLDRGLGPARDARHGKRHHGDDRGGARTRGRVPRAARPHTALTLSGLTGLTLALLAALASPWLADALYHDRAWTWVVLAGAATVPLSAIASLRVSILQGHQAVKPMAALNAVVAAAGIATIIPLPWFFGLRGAVAQLVVVAGVYAWASGRMVARHAGVPGGEEAAAGA